MVDVGLACAETVSFKLEVSAMAAPHSCHHVRAVAFVPARSRGVKLNM